MKRNEFLDYLKGCLILLVTTGHALQYVVHWDGSFWGDPLFKAIYLFHMPLFMAVAGYLSRRSIDASPAVQTITSKFAAYMVPVVVWTGLFVAVTGAAGGVTDWKAIPKMAVHEMAERMWFLWSLFGAIVVTALARLARGYFPIAYLLSLGLVMLLPDSANLYLFKYTYPFFQIGYLAAGGGLPGFAFKRKAAIVVALSVAAVWCYATWNDAVYIYVSKMRLHADNGWNIGFRFVAGLVWSALALYAFSFSQRLCPASVRALLHAFGRDSVYIYTIQGYLFLLLGWLGTSFVPATLSAPLGWTLAASVGLFACWACWMMGVALSRSRFLARVLFGKGMSPRQATAQAG